MRTLRLGLLSIFGLFAFSAWAVETAAPPEVSFVQVWAKVKGSAPLLRASSEEFEAAQIAQARSSRHWYPRLSLTGKAFSTNDPGAVFMNALDQRNIGSADFAPSALNHPGSQFFEQGTLALALPLYEGGMRVAQAEVAEKNAAAKKLEITAAHLNEFTQVAQAYSMLLVLTEQRKHLSALLESVTGIIERYHVGAKSNPIGYSGLLGLKNLRNRVTGLLVENETRAYANRIEIDTVAAGLPEDWRPQSIRAKDFLSHIFPKSRLGGEPVAVLAARAGVESLERANGVEQARFLPRVGLFAQGDLYAGSRASATSFSSGAYLQWDLFTAGNFGAASESIHRAAAAEARAESLQRKMKGTLESADSGAIAAEKSLVLLDESARFLEEQTQAARSLFLNGSINALQLAEVLSRRADLLVTRSEVETTLTQMRAAGFLAAAHEGGLDDLGK